MDILITGGAGFIGSRFVRHILSKTKRHRIVVLDKLTYAGNLENLKDVENKWGIKTAHPRYFFIKGDILNAPLVEAVISGKWKNKIWRSAPVGTIVHFAAQTHVDRSIYQARQFVGTNVLGTQTLLDAVRKAKQQIRFIHISTDEVYGSLGRSGIFTENSPLAPRSPYSASKASADMLVASYVHTYGIGAIITRSSNNYGSHQFPEKFIPLMILRAMENKPLPVYGKGKNIRDWLYVKDHCSALLKIFQKGRPGEIYNIGGNCEKENLEVALSILDILKKPHSLIQFVKDRPGHDFRYALSTKKIRRELGWKPKVRFEDGVKNTIDWYTKNAEWIKSVTSGAYRKYFKTMYGARGMRF